MIIEKLTLQNFGIYYGTYTLDLSLSKSDQNIILIGGENGSGKTTLLDAIKIALYGPLSLGYKTSNDRYLEQIRDKYYNFFAYDEETDPCFIEMDFTLFQEGVKNKYSLKRGWVLKNSNLKEIYLVIKNNKEISKKELIDFENYIRKFLPPSLFDIFFFDGEKISQMFKNLSFEDHFRASAMTLFNLDLFDILREDLKKYLKQDNIFSTLSEEQQKLTLIQEQYNNLQYVLDIKKDKVERLRSLIKEKQVEKETLNEEFRLNGGLLADEKARIQHKLTVLENERKSLNEELKTFIGNILPFLLVNDKLRLVQNQIEHEKDLNNYYTTKSKLNHQVLSEIVDSFYSKNELIDSESKIDLLHHLYDEIENKIKPLDDNDKVIHNLSSTETTQILSFIHQLKKFDSHFAIDCMEKLVNSRNETIELRHQYKQTFDNEALDGLFTQIQELDIQINKFIAEETLLSSEIDDTAEKLDSLTVELNKSAEQIKQAKKDQSVYNVTKQVDKILAEFISHVSEARFKEIEEYFYEMFSNLIRKDEFISQVNINKKDFHLSLFNSNNHGLSNENLSAGEGQIYMLSLLWAIIKTSQREIPLVFDTLLGRLDQTHKKNIIQNLLPYIGKQVIVLSTNTEIDEYYYKLLFPHIGKEYVLAYDHLTKKVEIETEYFFKRGENHAI